MRVTAVDHSLAWAREMQRIGEICTAAPQVVAYRTQRMLLAGAQPSARDRREFARMGQEKVEAFTESFSAMGWQLWLAQQSQATALMSAWWRMWLGPLGAGLRAEAKVQPALAELWARGLDPVHRRVTANERRLRRQATLAWRR